MLTEIAQTAIPGETSGGFEHRVFLRLLRHRVQAEALIGFHRGILECSIPVLAGVMLAQVQVGARLRESLQLIDSWICRLLDPDARTFTRTELIERFGWPDIDAREQEAKEMWEG